MDKKTDYILNKNPIWKGLIYLAFPVFLVNILKTLHDIVDTFFLGKVPGDYLNVDGELTLVATAMQSAVSLTWPIFFIFISFGMGLSVAGNSLIAQYVGKGDMVSAKKFANNTLFISLILGVLFNIVVYISAPYILTTVSDNERVFNYAVTYLRIRSFELPVLFLAFAFQAIRRATGDTLTPVMTSAVSLVLNIIFTPILVLVLGMGITGAAIATLTAQWLLMPMMVYYLKKSKTGITVSFDIKTMNRVIVKDIFHIGIPASLGQSIQAVGFVVLNLLIFTYGESVQSAFFIGNRINSLVMFPVSSVSAIVAIYIAQNVGFGNVERAKKSVRQGILIGVLMMAAGVAIVIPFRSVLVSIFSDDPKAIEYGKTYVLYIGLGLPLMALFQTYLNAFQGTGETQYSFILAIVRLWFFRLPFVLISMYVLKMGPIGIWYSMLLSNVLAAILGAYLYSRVKFIPKTKEFV